MNSSIDDHLVMGRPFRNPKEPFVLYPAANEWEHWMSKTPDAKVWWGPGGGEFNPAMVDEYAEHALAGVLHVKKVYHYEIPDWSLFNEPSNCARPSKETWLALVKATGRKFKEAGLKTKIVIADDVTPERTADSVEYVLADPEARNYIGAVSYHRYIGDFVLEQVKPMLAKADKGEPLVAQPVSFYNSAVKYGKSVWLSEQCSYGDDGITLYDAGRARSNHICDEINNGGVNAFDFMLTYFIERGRPGNEETPIFIRFKDRKFASVEINPFGEWIRQFTRHIRPGSVKLGISTDDPLVKAVAFRDDKNGKLVIVTLSNHAEPTSVDLKINGVPKMATKASRIRSAGTELYQPLAGIIVKQGSLQDELPAKSITTYEISTK